VNAHAGPLPDVDPAPELGAEIDLDTAPPSTDLHDPAQRRRVEQELGRVPGVLAARLVPGFERRVDELHVVTTPDRGPKGTVRDAQTVLMARFGIPLDHRVISVVQLDERQVLASAARVVIDEVGIVRSGTGVVAEVVLARDEEHARATADGAATTGGRDRAVASATIAAVQQLLEIDLRMELRGVELVQTGGHEIALSVLELRDPRGQDLLCGTAIVRDSAPDAVARSVLDALNRTLEEAASAS